MVAVGRGTSARPLRIALLSPKGPLYRHRGGIWKKSLRYQPLTLTTLAALVPPDIPHELTLVDEGIADIPLDLDVDVVGITVITGTARRAYELAAHFRSRGITVVLGGPHVTLIPDEAEQHADAICIGYAEESWPQLLHDLVAGTLQRRYTQAPGLDIGGRPFPRRDLLPSQHFITNNVFEATRGCVHPCEFCVVPTAWGRKPYLKPVEEVVADIRQHGARKLIFIDLNIIADRAHTIRLFTALIPLKLQWYGLATVLLADDEELLGLAEASGCAGLLMGLESLSVANLKGNRKGFNSPENYARVVQQLHRHGIALQGCFVFGLDEDHPDVFLKTAEFAVEAGIDLPRFAVVTPFPNTPLFKRLEAEGRILTKDWECYDAQHVVFQPRHMSVRELQEGIERAWKHAYSIPSMWRRIRRSPAPWPVRIGTNLGYRFYAHNLSRFYNCDWIIGRAPSGRPMPPPTMPRAPVSAPALDVRATTLPVVEATTEPPRQKVAP